MIKAPMTLRDLRRKIYVKAKAEPSWRFWGLYVHVCKMETLRTANKQRRGFGWRWRRRDWMYGTLGLFADYRVRYYQPSTGVSGR